MVPLKDLRPLMLDKEATSVSEFGLLDFEFFDDVKFAKQVADNYKLTFIDLTKAKVQDRMLKMLKRGVMVQYRAIPIQKTAKAVSLAIYDPSIIELKQELQTALQSPVEFILTNISAWKKIFERIEESIDDLLETIKEVRSETEDEKEDIKEEDIGEDVINYVNKILAEAFIKKV